MKGFQQALFAHLESPQRGWKNRKLDLALMALIIVNVIAVVLESDSGLADRYGGFFFWFEASSVAVFTLEYAARLWIAPMRVDDEGNPLFRSRWHYVVSPLALIDLVAILPFYLGLFMNIDLRVLRAFRLLRIFKLTRYSSAMDLLLSVIRRELPTFLSATFLMLVAVLLAASGIYLVEHKAQPEFFGSIPKSIWWAVVT